MLSLALLALNLVPAQALAATCPEGSSQTYVCQSTPQPGDGKLAGDVFDSITICRGDNGITVVPEKNGAAQAQAASVEDRDGGSTYTVVADPYRFDLSIPTGLPPEAPIVGKLTITHLTFKIASSSTYSCQL